MGERTRVWAEIDLGAATRNFRAIRARADGRRVIAVIKANAYGHGAILFARALADERCDAFAVISVEEAAELRAAGVRAPILILGGPMTPEDADRARARRSLVVSRAEALDWLEAAAGAPADRRLPARARHRNGSARAGARRLGAFSPGSVRRSACASTA